MRYGVVVFPGSNGDHDALMSVERGLGLEVVPIWHKDTSVGDVDALLVPGGFSYGDYLRAGAIARFSPIMGAVSEFAEQGRPVLGICNGFQILTEAGLLPGALLRNANLAFSCKWVHTRVETDRTPFTRGIDPGTVLRLPIAHGEGRFFAEPVQLDALEANEQIVFRYTDEWGMESEGSNPNGSSRHIAGICNLRGNVVGLMPHPERAYDALIGGDEGLRVLGAVVGHFMPMAAV
ncbi:MAG TPA: phosphoribosylformylglycinamidine synthase subunit PurQ [Thermomicrobiales bacterium]|nr:phosphoribosylformylglycinamidine synthase subunit PurQ [Thermomicrobiales bacterium]